MHENGVIILAIESSCDDTAASVIRDGVILSNIVSNQAIHARYGGIVPEVASRLHQENIALVVDAALKDAGVGVKDLVAVACTAGPGLMGSLAVGMSFAKGMALSLSIPFITVDHMEAHVLSHYIDDPKPAFPFLCLTVSGGHTQIVLVHSPEEMKILGQTLDDAAGEAFDKSGKLLGLPYPAGPLIDQWAGKGNPVFPFPVPKVDGLNFSFSGLKTSILYFVKAEMKKDPDFVQKRLADICASIQHAIIEILIQKIIKAADETGIREIGIAGGVAANTGLRKRLMETGQEKNWNLYYPALQYCTDNAGMIAIASLYRYRQGKFSSLDYSLYAQQKDT